MTLTDSDLRERIETLIRALDDDGVERDEVEEALTSGYGYALAKDSQRLRLEQRITELAARAEEPGAASELRTLWLRHRTLDAELSELRGMLRELRDHQLARGV
jgi:hypothetical protein